MSNGDSLIVSDMAPASILLTANARTLRDEVRAFIAQELEAATFRPSCDSWLSGWDEAFSRKLGVRGWIGMTIPVELGGHGRTALERYVVTEELLAAGAPLAAHWITDRQIVPSLLRFGTDEQQRQYLPRIAAGECYFAIGLSEPDAGSDLASIRTRARRSTDGWTLSGTKVWTSGAHRAHAISVLARTSERDPSNSRSGMTQFIVDTSSPGLSIRPISFLTGQHHFNEVVLDDVFVPDEYVLGGIGEGWDQVTSELAYERSGPERWLSTFALLATFINEVRLGRIETNDTVRRSIGDLLTRMWVLRQMSLSVAGAIGRGEIPEVAAAVVKDLGTQFEGDLIDVIRLAADVEPDLTGDGLALDLAEAVLHSPVFTLRGGTNEILRGVLARALGMR